MWGLPRCPKSAAWSPHLALPVLQAPPRTADHLATQRILSSALKQVRLEGTDQLIPGRKARESEQSNSLAEALLGSVAISAIQTKQDILVSINTAAGKAQAQVFTQKLSPPEAQRNLGTLTN